MTTKAIPAADADPASSVTAAPKDSDWSILPHPLADIFPLLDEDGLRALAEDIHANGLREPIVLYEGKILDGRCRYRACAIAGVLPDTEDYAGADPVAFVISQNLRRRHLTESQRAMVAAQLADLPRGANQHTTEGLPIGGAAKLLNVSERSVARAKEVLRKGGPALLGKVMSGTLKVSATARGLQPTPSNQKAPATDTMGAKNDAAFASLTAAWENAAELRRAWGTAPAIVRDHFIVKVLRRLPDDES